MHQLTELYNLLGINLDEYEIILTIPKISKTKQILSYEEVKEILKEIYDSNSECKFVGSHSLSELLNEMCSNVFDVVCKDDKSMEMLIKYLESRGYKEKEVIEDYSIEIIACNKKYPYECRKIVLPTCFGEVSLEKDGIKVNLFYEGMICIKYVNHSINTETIRYIENVIKWTIAYKLIRGTPKDLEHLKKLKEKGISIEEILSYVNEYESNLKEIYPDYKERVKRNLRKLQRL